MKYTLDTTLEEAMKDERVMKILKSRLKFIVMHPRFSEAYGYSFREIIDDNMGEAVGLQVDIVKRVVNEILELGE